MNSASPKVFIAQSRCLLNFLQYGCKTLIVQENKLTLFTNNVFVVFSQVDGNKRLANKKW